MELLERLLRWTANAEATALKLAEQGAETGARYYLDMSDKYRAQYRAAKKAAA